MAEIQTLGEVVDEHEHWGRGRSPSVVLQAVVDSILLVGMLVGAQEADGRR